MKKKIKPLVFIISFVIMSAFLYKYIFLVSAVLTNSFFIVTMATNYTELSTYIMLLMFLSLYVLFGYAVYILYRYLILILDLVENKKILKAILMLIIAIVTLIVVILVRQNITTRAVLLWLSYIAGVIVLPLVIIGFSILDKKSNKVKIIISVLIAIIIYISNFSQVSLATGFLISHISDKSISEIFGGSKKDINLTYLENYRQKQVRTLYLDKFDIQNILSTVDSRSDFVQIDYNTDSEVIRTNNKEENWRQNLEDKLEWNYYKFEYDYKDEQTTIYIQRYMSTTDLAESNERNKDIIVEGTLKNNIIKNINTVADRMEAENYTFYNEIVLDEKETNTEIENFKILFAYDEKTNNFIPYVDNETQLNKIKSYKIYSTGMSITLEDGVKTKNDYYTIRTNRYGSDYKLREDRDDRYYYIFEPVVTKLTDWNNNTVLEFKFENLYLLRELKNIEILFGYNK